MYESQKKIEKMKENEKSEEEDRGERVRAKQSNAWSVARLTEENEMRGRRVNIVDSGFGHRTEPLQMQTKKCER